MKDVLSVAAVCLASGLAPHVASAADQPAAGKTIVLTVNGSTSKWPELISVGKTTTTVTWTCTESSNPQIKTSPDMRSEDEFQLADGASVSSRKFVASTMAAVVDCKVHRLEFTTSGAGQLKVK